MVLFHQINLKGFGVWVLKVSLSTSSCLKKSTVFWKYSVSVSRQFIDFAQAPCFWNSCFQKVSQESPDPGLQVRFGQYSFISFYHSGFSLFESKLNDFRFWLIGEQPWLKFSIRWVETGIFTTAILWKVAAMLLVFVIWPQSVNNPLVNICFSVLLDQASQRLYWCWWLNLLLSIFHITIPGILQVFPFVIKNRHAVSGQFIDNAK